MNILELDSYRLADAVRFHNRLNPRLWNRDEHLLPEVRKKLLAIAADFQEFLGIDDLKVKDITISGSNAAYSYTPQSDIDLHIVVEMPDDPVYQELFTAKKYQYNDEHDIKIRGADVELYVQPADQKHVSLGIYSVKNNDWVQIPRRKRASIDDSCVQAKTQDLNARVQQALASGSREHMQTLWDKIKTMRQTGLDQHGEFGCENIAFKLLRRHGVLEQLKSALTAARDQELSLREQPRRPVRYGFSEASTPDGVSPSTKMFLSETDAESIVQDFIQQTAQRLGIKSLPTIHLHTDPEWSADNHSFGMYQPESHELYVNLHNRHILDILRTTAHELVHCRQNEIEPLDVNAGDTGSEFENEAHAVAGIIMRDYADAHPEIFDDQPITESSGYIPTEAEKNDPRFVMALTADVRPGATGLNANRMSLNTDAQGRPQLLRADGVVELAESLRSELAQLDDRTATDQVSARVRPSRGDGRRREINAPLGPETPPTMPRGTVRVDVSDIYDWYKLGKNIANLDQANPADFGKGPPSTIVSFGDEDTEHKYIKGLEKLGLTTTDIDPVDPDQPADMPRQKTDPTYNVSEQDEDLVESLQQEFELLEQEFLSEINMGSKNLRREAAKTGAIAGMEFEMIVPGIKSEDPEQEPDYEADQRCRSIEDAVQFFHDGDYNGRRDVERLRERMEQDFYEWLDEKIQDEFGSDGEDYIVDWIANNVDESEWNPDDLEGDDRNEALIEFAVNVHADPSSDYYNQAFDEYRDENRENWDESDWLDSQDLDLMSAIENAYDITWPYWTDMNSGEVDADQVADEFSQAVGKEVRVNTRYHQSGARPGPNNQFYVVEPDGSLEGDDDTDEGLEFVSPPMPIDELLKDLNAVKAWAGRMGVYTNSSTGLHINISVPDYSLDQLDFVKLALLLGDEYVLSQFGRSSNTYAKSALKIVKEKVRGNPDVAERLLEKMKGQMGELASKAIHSGVTNKYTSINTKDGHIEFRSPGGDWLDENFDKIENTLLRFTVAMSAALNPEAYKEEYQKKLYKLLTADQKDSDTIRYFSDYVAGKIPQAALRSFVKQAQLERKLKRGEANNQPMWWAVSNPPHSYASIEVVAATKEEAIEKALGADGYPSWANTRQSVVAKPLRPYEKKNVGVGSQTDMENRLGWPDQTGDANYEIVDRRTMQPVFLFIANTDVDAAEKYQQWLAAAGYSEDTENYGWRQLETTQSTPVPGSTIDLQRQRAAQEIPEVPLDIEIAPPRSPASSAPAGNSFSGQWKVLVNGEEVWRFRGIGNSQADANRIAAQWLRDNGMGVSGEGYEVVPVMI